MAALTLALTLPDICGRSEYGSIQVGKRYKSWYESYIGQYEKPGDAYGDDMPYLSGEIIYSLRCQLLHIGNPNITQNQIKEPTCKVDHFVLKVNDATLSDLSVISYENNPNNLERSYEASVDLLCRKLCKVALQYYENNREKFNFFTYRICDATD